MRYWQNSEVVAECRNTSVDVRTQLIPLGNSKVLIDIQRFKGHTKIVVGQRHSKTYLEYECFTFFEV